MHICACMCVCVVCVCTCMRVDVHVFVYVREGGADLCMNVHVCVSVCADGVNSLGVCL